MNHNPTPMKAQFLPLFNINLSQPKLNSISTKLRLNFTSTSFQPQVQINLSLNINLNSTSTITSAQYGCDIKATQSCHDLMSDFLRPLLCVKLISGIFQFVIKKSNYFCHFIYFWYLVSEVLMVLGYLVSEILKYV